MTGHATPALRKAPPAAGTTPGTAQAPPAPGAAGPAPRRTALLPTAALILGALNCQLPVAWVVVAAPQADDELLTTFT
ncbi:carbohydrate ABC transporter permease, partial [Streptomyces hydrogenans]